MFEIISVALAQEAAAPATTVTIPWGEWLTGLVNVALPAVGTLLTGIASYVVAAYVPPWLKAITGQRGQQRVNEVINKAVLSAVAQVRGALLGKQLEIDVANDVLRRAMQYAVDQAPDLVKSAARDNVENLARMVMARMVEHGLLPADYSMKAAKPAASTEVVNNETGKSAVVPKKDFSFEDATRTGMGGH